MMFFLVLACLAHSPSIHQIEYENHLDDAVFSVVNQTQLAYVPLQARSRGMNKDYYGYCPYWIDTIYYDYFQMELLTHIAYFSVEIDPTDGSLGGIPYLSRFTCIRDHSHANGILIHMTFIVFGSSNVSAFLNNATARQNAINNISDFMTNYGIEGANIDFEFVTSSVRDSFNLFINDLSVELWGHSGGRKDVYIASIAVPEWYPGYDIDYLADHCDGLFIMAYDFHWSGSSVAGPVSPCVPSSFWGQYCAAKSIGSYKAYGVDGSKIILGIPYYGYDWPTVSQDMGSATTGTASAKIYYYAFQNANTYGRIWDDYSLTPWYRYYTSEWHQCWYDDSVSLDIKFGMVNDSLLEGAGCWALGYDRSYDHLWNAIRNNFWDPQGIAEEESKPEYAQPMLEVYPNPFSGKINIGYRIQDARYMRKDFSLKIYDVSGRIVKSFNLTSNFLLPASAVSWDGTDHAGCKLPPGVYFVRMKAGDITVVKKAVLLR